MDKRKWLYPSIITAHFFLLIVQAAAQSPSSAQQDSLSGTYTDISTIGLKKEMTGTFSTAYISKNEKLESSFPLLHFTPGAGYKGPVPNELVTKKAILRFNLTNTADSSVRIYFFPGFYYSDIRLYRLQDKKLEALPSVLPNNPDSIGYRGIILAPHDSATLFAQLIFVKTYIDVIHPRLINPQYVDAFVIELHGSHSANDLITYVFCGLLLMMILYSMANYFQGANPEFFHYSGYAFFLGLMLFSKAALNFHCSRLSFFIESYLDFVMQSLGIMFYMLFMQRFLDTRNHYRFLHGLYNAGIVLLPLSILSYSYFHFFSDNFMAENTIENTTKVLLLVMILIFLAYSVRHWENKLLRYMFWGNFFLFIFSLISQVIVMVGPKFRGLPAIFNSSLFYYEIGLLLELAFFMGGLNHKNRRNIIEQTKEREGLKAENRMKEYEKELAVYKAQQEERERISADMHDELGSGMTAIRLFSEIARNKMKENTPIEIEKISHSANDVLNKMNAIIWSMNSGNDTLDNLVSYIRSYSLEYFDNTPIQCKVNTPENIPAMELSGDKRRNIFLSVKETLNNAWKHSEASVITIDIKVNHSLQIEIADNGKGIDLQQIRQFGNGLKNIARRMDSIGGSFTIKNSHGTLTMLDLPL